MSSFFLSILQHTNDRLPSNSRRSTRESPGASPGVRKSPKSSRDELGHLEGSTEIGTLILRHDGGDCLRESTKVMLIGVEERSNRTKTRDRR